MKKLMIAAAIVCAAAYVQAASCSWGGSLSFEDGDGEVATGSVVFFINGVLQGSAVVIQPTGLASYGTWTVNGGDTLKIIATVTNFGESGDITGTKEWSYALTDSWIGDYADPESAAAALAAEAMLGVSIPETLAAGAAANGYTAVPEPTSGLLLLLGVAGLALRRRRA